MNVGPDCVYCGQKVGTSWSVSALGAPFCQSHRDRPKCHVCASPAADAAPDSGLCAQCLPEAVWTQADSTREFAGIREDMHALDLRLTVPVQVDLMERSELAARRGGQSNTTGLTEWVGDRVVAISVAKGLVRREFGSTVVHECMHAWMFQNKFPTMSGQVSEGLCQAMAYRYLQRYAEQEPRAKLLAKGISELPDPVYGEGFRLVLASATTYGFPAVIESVRRSGQLP